MRDESNACAFYVCMQCVSYIYKIVKLELGKEEPPQ